LSRHQRSAPVLTLKTKVTLLEKELPAFSIDAQKRLVTVRFEGTVTFDEIARYAKRLLAHRDFEPTFSEITDLREVSELNLQANDFLRLADKIDPFWPEATRAFVVRTAVQTTRRGCTRFCALSARLKSFNLSMLQKSGSSRNEK